MMRSTAGQIWRSTAVGLLVGLALLLPSASGAQERPEARVHAILFYSPTCPHCHALINDYLVPLQQEYGDRLVLLAFDVTQGWASEIYWAALRHYEVPQEDWVVPIMILGEEVLIGGDEIPNRLIPVLETFLPDRGVDLPNLPALLDLLDQEGMLDHRFPDRRIVVQPAHEEEPAAQEPTVEEPTPQNPQESPADSTVSGDTAAPPVDTITPPSDSVAAPREEPSRDTLAAGQTAVPAEPSSVEPDSLRERTPVPARAEVETEPELSPPGDSSTAPDVAGAVSGGGGGEDEPPDSAAGSVVPRAADSPEAEPPSARPTDLSGALEDMASVTMMDRFNQDRAGGFLAVTVLLVMLVSVALKGFPARGSGKAWPGWVIPFLVVVGVGVAGYLSFIEVTHTEAVCGPVGDCNTVNQSEYATLFGFLPVGILGLLGYALILATWIFGRRGPEGLRSRADLALWGAALFGTLFSIYLTFLEPFVIGATCAWCLTSALIMTLLLWATSPLAARVWPGGGDDGP